MDVRHFAVSVQLAHLSIIASTSSPHHHGSTSGSRSAIIPRAVHVPPAISPNYSDSLFGWCPVCIFASCSSPPSRILLGLADQIFEDAVQVGSLCERYEMRSVPLGPTELVALPPPFDTAMPYHHTTPIFVRQGFVICRFHHSSALGGCGSFAMCKSCVILCTCISIQFIFRLALRASGFSP